MKILGLDVSTKTGYAVMEDGKLIEYGLLQTEEEDLELIQDFKFLKRAESAAGKIVDIILRHKPDYIFCEQTNAGQFRDSQKLLEFTHCKILTEIVKLGMSKIYFYVDTSAWRSTLGVKLNKEQRKHNKAVKDGTARGKITPKHLVVLWANAKYGLKLLKKDHDIGDGIAVAEYGTQKMSQPKAQYEYDLDKILTT